ncbi:O-methyltransferase-domain-containing protein [Cladochytrium replicatum]|nr:O-methyltransferase-domain-containing protein [Cladochytrium replicatum]
MIQRFGALIAVAGMAGELWSLRALIALVFNLGVPDVLADGPVTAEEIAEKLKLHTPSIISAMRGAVDRGFMTVDPATRLFALTEGWCSYDRPCPGLWEPWAHAEHSVPTGESEPSRPSARTSCPTNSKHPEEFSDAMTYFSSTEVEQLIAKYCDPKVIVDVASGNGPFLKAILDALPNARGIVFDLPQVVDNLPVDAPAAGHERIQLVGGSFLELVIPSGSEPVQR